MADYQETRDPSVLLRLADGAYIPKVVGNRDYDQVLREIASGQADIAPAEPVPTPEPEPTPRELLAALTDVLIAKGHLTKSDLPADLAVAVDAIAIDKP